MKYKVTILDNKSEGHNKPHSFIIELEEKPVCGDVIVYENKKYTVCGICKANEEDCYYMFVNANPKVFNIK